MKKPIAGGTNGAVVVALPHPGTRRARGLTRFLESERLLASLLLAPTVVLLGTFIAYPFVSGVWLSLSDTSVGNVGHFVGLKNFAKAWDDSIFQQAFRNTFFYTFWATIFKLALGMWLALLLNRSFRGKRLVRASMLLPFIIPTVLSTFAWRWMFDPTFSVLNWLLFRTGFIVNKIPFLSDGVYGMWCAIVVNTWRGMPFFAITLLAGLQTVNPDLHEAAEIDGANAWQRFWRVTLPLIKPIMLVVVLFSMIATFADFQLIYVLTRGGPYSSTHVFGTYAYEIAMRAAKLGQGASISLFLFPFLLMIIVFQLWYIRRSD